MKKKKITITDYDLMEIREMYEFAISTANVDSERSAILLHCFVLCTEIIRNVDYIKGLLVIIDKRNNKDSHRNVMAFLIKIKKR